MDSNVTPSIPGAPLFSWPSCRLRTEFPSSRHGRRVPRSARRFSLRLDVYPPPHGLQTDGCFCHSPLPSFYRSHCRQQSSFAPRTLLRFSATTGPSITLSSSTDFPVFPVIRLPCFRPFLDGRGGLLQLLNASWSSCCRYHPARVECRCRSVCVTPCCL